MTNVRRDIFADDTCEAVVPTGVGDLELMINSWMESHSPQGGRGAHLALRQTRRADAVPIVVHLTQVPALVAALTETALRLAQSWERGGEEYWAGHPRPSGTGPQDPG